MRLDQKTQLVVSQTKSTSRAAPIYLLPVTRMSEPFPRTVLSKLRLVFILSRLATGIGLFFWLWLAPSGVTRPSLGLFVLAIFGIHLLLFYWLSSRRFVAISPLYQVTTVFDIFFIALVTYATDGFQSAFFLFYLLVISFGAFYFGTRFGLVLSGLATVVYTVFNFKMLPAVFVGDLVLRLALLWLFAVAVGLIARYLRGSEFRLLRALDTLNERTTELEKSQVQIETIYETSRALGEMHNLEEVINEILNIARRVLGYQMCSVLLLNAREDRLLLMGKIETGEKIIYREPLVVPLNSITGAVAKSGKPERIADVTKDNRYQPGLSGARSEMVVPMISRGNVLGVLNAESKQFAFFLEKDQKIFSILANSAALALENAVMHKKLEELIIIDGLTGVFNFRYFSNRLVEEFRRANRYNQPLSLIMVDIDFFKKCNDNHGHEAGNQVLKEIAQVIRNSIRDVDILARYGGEEFMVILPQTDRRDALLIGERIRAQVASSTFGNGSTIPSIHLTVSVGVTSYPENGRSQDEIVAVVDQALYRAKGSGRNLVCAI